MNERQFYMPHYLIKFTKLVQLQEENRGEGCCLETLSYIVLIFACILCILQMNLNLD